MRASGSSSALLTSIDDALKSLDEAITAEVEEETAAREEREEGLPPRQLQEDAESRDSPYARCVVYGDLDDMDEQARTMLHQQRTAGARFLQAALRSCLQARQSAVLAELLAHGYAVAAPQSSHRWLGGDDPPAWSSVTRPTMPALQQLARLLGGMERRHRRRSRLWAWRRLHQHAAHAAAAATSFQDASEDDGSTQRVGTPGGVRRTVASIEQRQSMQGQLAAVDAESRWLRKALRIEQVLSGGLLQSAVRLHQAKQDAFVALRLHAASQRPEAPPRQVTSSRSYPMVRRRDPLATARLAMPVVEYAAQTRVISARWMVCLLIQAQHRARDHAWRQLVAHTHLCRAQHMLAQAQRSSLATSALREACRSAGGRAHRRLVEGGLPGLQCRLAAVTAGDDDPLATPASSVDRWPCCPSGWR